MFLTALWKIKEERRSSCLWPVYIVEHDRDTSLRYLQQAVTTASSQRGTGGKLVRSWFRESRLFGAVQDDDAFLQVVGRE